MASVTPKITPDQIDDLLYCARAGETDDLIAYLDELLGSSSSSPSASTTATPNIAFSAPSAVEHRTKYIAAVLEQALDEGGNGMLHYASANGHLGESDRAP